MSIFERIFAAPKPADAADGLQPPPPAMHTPVPPAPIAVRPLRFRAPAGSYVGGLRAPLVTLSAAGDLWTVENAMGGCSVLGSNGSGKTSTSGQTLAKSYLRAGWGGLVMCAKADEAALWKRYARECGRARDVIHVTRDSPWRFNFLAYEMGRHGDPSTRVENIVTLLMTLMDQQGRTQGGGDSKQWQNAAEALLRNTVMVLAAARSHFTLFDVQQFIDTVPMSEQEARDDRDTSFSKTLDLAKKAYLAARRSADYDVIENYFKIQFPRLADRTRSSITITLSTMMQDLLSGLPRELFATATNFFPDDSFEGAIILLDLPVVENRVNRTAQALFKTAWQMAALRRPGLPGWSMTNARPVFLWADESHLFVTEYDTSFQTLARSAKACTVYLTQNLSNYEAELGERGEIFARRLMGLFQTHIFHAQTDPHTLEWIVRLFGRMEVTRLNRNFSASRSRNASVSRNINDSQSAGKDGAWSQGVSWGRSTSLGSSRSTSAGWNESTQVEDALFHSHLTTLPNGSDRYRGVAGAFVFQNANTWRHGNHILYTQFSRRLA